MSNENDLHPLSTVLRYQVGSGSWKVDPLKLRDLIAQIDELVAAGLPGTAIHNISFMKGVLEVEVR